MMPLKQRYSWRHATVLVCATGVMLSGGSAVQGQSDAALEVNALVDQLAAATLAERDQATDELEQFEGSLEPLLRPRLARGDLSPEQSARLETILHFRFMESPRAALGVGFAVPGIVNNRAQQTPVVLDRILGGFPCSKTLKPGDVIRVVDGFELPPTGGGNRVRSAILSHLPGEELELTIERDGRRSFLRIPLGDYTRLNNVGPARITPAPAMLNSAWSLRKARLGLGSATLSPLPLVEGKRSALPDLPERKTPEIWAGGSPDNGATLLHQLRSRASNQSQKKIAATAARRINVVQPGARRVEVRMQPLNNSPKARVIRLEAQLMQARANRERYLLIVAREGIGPQQQRAVKEALTLIEAQIASIKSDIAELNGQKKDAGVKPQD